MLDKNNQLTDDKLKVENYKTDSKKNSDYSKDQKKPIKNPTILPRVDDLGSGDL